MFRIYGITMEMVCKILKPFMILLIGAEIVDEMAGSNLYEKLERSRALRFVDRIVDAIIGCMLKIMFNVFMIGITGGLWIFWLMYKRNKKRRRMA